VLKLSHPDGQLRLGMYDHAIQHGERCAGGDGATRGHPDHRGRQVVFVAVPDEEGKFFQRTVTLGPLAGEAYTVLQGLQSGEIVVTEGSFFLRAESLRNAPSG
jgi:multidrug efflux pump subunit AcrA (membrane-fusion protein)